MMQKTWLSLSLVFLVTAAVSLTSGNLLAQETENSPRAAEAQVEDIDWKKGAWGDLSQHIGTYHIETVLNDQRVSGILEKQLGAEKKQDLLNMMEVKVPIGFEDNCLLLNGNMSGVGNENAAFIAVCLYEGIIHTALMEGGAITLYTPARKYDYLPAAMKLWVYSQINPRAYRLPEGVQLMLVP